MYLIDTDVVSEARKGLRANPGVRDFLSRAGTGGATNYLSVISIGELRRGVEMVRCRGDHDQAKLLEAWLVLVLDDYRDRILNFGPDAAQVWGRLRAPDPAHPFDKQIAAIALVHDLIVVTRNTADFDGTGVRLLNPFVTRPVEN